MGKINTQTLKGFRDFLPPEARKRQYVIDTLKQVFESYGFEPLETPALEYEEVLLGKYGEEGNKLMYRFKDNGGRKVALRYDQTVPLARVVAQYGQQLPTPFKRSQIQPVWRAENPQKGRYREFLQCDIDTVGTSSFLADSEIVACTIDALKKLGFNAPQIWINDRTIFDNLGLKKEEVIILDKLEKLGDKIVISQLQKRGRKDAEKIFNELKEAEPTKSLNEIFRFLEYLGYQKGKDFLFVPYLARGLDYYTSTIFEAKIPNSTILLSLAGGGRYDNLIGIFANLKIPATGLSFGFDRIVEAMEELDLFPAELKAATPKVLVTVFDSSLVEKSIEAVNMLREAGIPTELYPDENTKMEKQLKYADKRGIPYSVIIGAKEVKEDTVTLKNMQTGEQKIISLKDIAEGVDRLL